MRYGVNTLILQCGKTRDSINKTNKQTRKQKRREQKLIRRTVNFKKTGEALI